ncbi:hypothetical protein [uncultured Thiocystis sp.]|uniref:hypothetical protein n=1 Tax=uncultured Thiocystis sp. TaxID=1202134 RepID=UPI0025E7B6E2|nr:hypothetical protein [uncultured Thiocystis sp.]
MHQEDQGLAEAHCGLARDKRQQSHEQHHRDAIVEQRLPGDFYLLNLIQPALVERLLTLVAVWAV